MSERVNLKKDEGEQKRIESFDSEEDKCSEDIYEKSFRNQIKNYQSHLAKQASQKELKLISQINQSNKDNKDLEE